MQTRVKATKTVLLAGVAGGTVEVLWVLLFCLVSPLQGTLVAEQITQSFWPQMAGFSAVTTGVIIHYVLAVLIAGVAAMTIFRMLAGNTEVRSVVAASTAVLVVVWATNFFVILPVVNPDFVTLMPYTLTFLSKVGFGVAMGWIYAIRIPASDGDSRQTTEGRLALR